MEPADDPAASARIAQLNATLSRLDQFKTNADFAPTTQQTAVNDLFRQRLADAATQFADLMGKELPAFAAADPAAKVHLYGKDVKPGRKVGHVTAYGDEEVAAQAIRAGARDYVKKTLDFAYVQRISDDIREILGSAPATPAVFTTTWDGRNMFTNVPGAPGQYLLGRYGLSSFPPGAYSRWVPM